MKTPVLLSLKCLLGLTLTGIVSSALAAGFDCTKSLSNTEKMICADSSVSEQDSTLNRLYLWKLESASQTEKPKLAAEQKKWMAQTRDVCTHVECLRDAYGARIKALSTIRYVGGAATYLAEGADIARVSGEIKQNLSKVGITQALGGCSHILSLDSHPGSYGAFCDLGGRRRVELCYENLAGNLALNFYGFSLTGAGLASFTQSVCPGG